MKRAGFTMIELIFVIVILGILAAVAIPKLAATRSDAQIAKLATNAATVVQDFGAGFTARGNFTNATTWISVTNTPLEKTAAGTAMADTDVISTPAVISDGTEICVTFTPVADGNATAGTTLWPSLTVATSGTGTICTAVASRVANLVKTHDFGGTGVQ